MKCLLNEDESGMGLVGSLFLLRDLGPSSTTLTSSRVTRGWL